MTPGPSLYLLIICSCLFMIVFILSCRFTGTIVRCENLDPLWPDSSWRYLKVTAYSMFIISIMVLNLMLIKG